MSDITWADLDTDEQRVMGVVKTYGYVLSDDEVDDGWVAPKCDPEVATRLQEYGLLLCLGKASPYNYKYVFTDAGRALLPAGEAVEVPSPSEAESDDAVFVELVKLYKAYKANPRDVHVRLAYFEALADARLTDFYKVLDDKKSLQADLAAALARAQVAEGEAARLRDTLESYADVTFYDVAWFLLDVHKESTSSVAKKLTTRAVLALSK